jgi:rod shape-determining protein MreC
MFERLYDTLYKYKEYVIFAGLVVLSLFLVALNDSVQVKRIRSVSAIVFGIVQQGLNVIPEYFGLQAENDMLRRTNIDLADEAQRLREAKLENFRLHELLKIKEQSAYPLTAAKVVAKNLTMLRNTITLNVGSNDGIKEQMCVIGDGGLVGIVTMVGQNYCIANMLLNTDFRVSCKVQRSRVDGIAAWDGSTLLLKNVVKTRDVKPGDIVITSGYSNLYPPDIRVGTVSSVQDQPSSLFKTIVLESGIDFVKLEEVFILHFVQNAECRTLEDAAVQRYGK